MELRKSYAAELSRLMKENGKIVVLDADLAGAGGTKPLYKEFPDRCINCGIAEANMTCIAAGLSASGYIPFIHSFAPFSSRRVFDQIAVSVSYSQLNVKIVGWDPGITATSNGGTHMSFEDVAMMRALPNIVVMDIVDDVQIAKALPFIAQHNGSVYVRMMRKQSESFFDADYQFHPMKADKLADGKDITIIASGALLFDARQAVRQLTEEGINADFLAVHTIKPLDEEAVLTSAQKTHAVLVVENHSIHGGLYSAVCETLSANNPTLCDAVAIRDAISQVGSLADLKKDYKLTATDIVAKAKQLVAKK